MTILDDLDSLVAAGNSVSLQFGWKANEYINIIAQKEKEAGYSAPQRTVLTEALNDLVERYNQYFANKDAARKTIADRIRVTRFFTKDRYDELPGKPTFNHLRATLVPDTWPDADEKGTMNIVSWAIENNWPLPQKIRGHRLGEENDENEQERRWRVLTEKAMAVYDDPLQSKERRDAAWHIVGLGDQRSLITS